MAASEPLIFSLRPTLITAIVLCLCLSCTAGCVSFPTGSDKTTYRPPTFEPTLRPTHIPIPSPTMVCEPTDNLTTAADSISEYVLWWHPCRSPLPATSITNYGTIHFAQRFAILI